MREVPVCGDLRQLGRDEPASGLTLEPLLGSTALSLPRGARANPSPEFEAFMGYLAHKETPTPR